MSPQTKKPSFLRISAIFEKIVQFTVNPYVTGSSPVARAKNYKPSTKGGFCFTMIKIPHTSIFFMRIITLLSKLSN